LTPVIDVDRHIIEYLPTLTDVLAGMGCDTAARYVRERFLPLQPTKSHAASEHGGRFKASWWAVPTWSASDRAAALAPALMYRHMDAEGVDMAILHSTLGLSIGAVPDPSIRVQIAMGINRYLAELTSGLTDRLIPSAIIPMAVPTDACDVLRDAASLGFRCITPEAPVWRYAADGSVQISGLGHGSDCDYSAFWALLADLEMAPMLHASGMGWAGRNSSANFIFNHLGAFAVGSDYVLRTLIFGSVFAEHPSLRFAFLEGGCSWFYELLIGLREHWDLRNAAVISRYDPSTLDVKRVERLLAEAGHPMLVRHLDQLGQALRLMEGDPPSCTDEFHSVGMPIDDLIDALAKRLYFGVDNETESHRLRACYAEALGVRANAVYGSDFGHWDASHNLGEPVRLAATYPSNGEHADEYLWKNAMRFFLDVNTDFFRGTRLAATADELRAGEPHGTDS